LFGAKKPSLTVFSKNNTNNSGGANIYTGGAKPPLDMPMPVIWIVVWLTMEGLYFSLH